MLAERLTRTYDANMSSLDALELACRADEKTFACRITSLELVTNNGGKATLATYEIESGMTVRHLALAEYKSDLDEQSLRSTHAASGYDFLFKGQAYIQNKPIEVLAFAGPHGDIGEP
jgi:hypothetical protein